MEIGKYVLFHTTIYLCVKFQPDPFSRLSVKEEQTYILTNFCIYIISKIIK